MAEDLRFLNCGESALTVELSKEISEETADKLRFLAGRLAQKDFKGVLETVPTFCSITVYFDPFVVTAARLQKKILKAMTQYKPDAAGSRRIRSSSRFRRRAYSRRRR